MTSITTTYGLDSQLTANYPILWDPLHGTGSQSWGWGGWRNSVTVGGNVSYTDHPSISYVPTRGEALAKTMFEPIEVTEIIRAIQTGWDEHYNTSERPDTDKHDDTEKDHEHYITPYCVKSVNNLQWYDDRDFRSLITLVAKLIHNGHLRICIDDAKGPTKYDITAHGIVMENCKEGGETGEKAGKAKTKNGAGGETGKNNKEKKAPAIALLVLDKVHANATDINNFNKYLWKSTSKGEKLYKTMVHMGLPEEKFKKLKYKLGDVDQKIFDEIKKWKSLKKAKFDDDEIDDDGIKAAAAYIKWLNGDYIEYKIIDGNRQPMTSGPNYDEIFVRTRSCLEVLRMLSHCIKLPDDQKARFGEEKAEKKETSLNFTIWSSKEHPKDTFVEINTNGSWFYIKGDDFASIRIFSRMQGILSMQETGTSQGTPVLTLPVQ
jgi:hypothetical protein